MVDKRTQAEGINNYWNSMTPQQRSAEMKRRMKRARKKLLASSESPFPSDADSSKIKSVSLSAGTIRQRLEAIEVALEAIKSEIG